MTKSSKKKKKKTQTNQKTTGQYTTTDYKIKFIEEDSSKYFLKRMMFFDKLSEISKINQSWLHGPYSPLWIVSTNVYQQELFLQKWYK